MEGLSCLFQPPRPQASLGCDCIPPASASVVTWPSCVPPSSFPCKDTVSGFSPIPMTIQEGLISMFSVYSHLQRPFPPSGLTHRLWGLG